MAARNRSVMKHASRFFSPVPTSVRSTRVDSDEFDESDIWGGQSVDLGTNDFSSPVRSIRSKPKSDLRSSVTGTGPSSLPVNIPDWSKILGEEYKNSLGTREWEVEDDDLAGETGTWIPPHEMACRNRTMSFSVHEGLGRTLKGRDLRRVRNAIWEKTGFQD